VTWDRTPLGLGTAPPAGRALRRLVEGLENAGILRVRSLRRCTGGWTRHNREYWPSALCTYVDWPIRAREASL